MSSGFNAAPSSSHWRIHTVDLGFAFHFRCTISPLFNGFAISFVLGQKRAKVKVSPSHCIRRIKAIYVGAARNQATLTFQMKHTHTPYLLLIYIYLVLSTLLYSTLQYTSYHQGSLIVVVVVSYLCIVVMDLLMERKRRGSVKGRFQLNGH